MLLRDQFTIDGVRDLKSYRNLLDTVSACENLALALVSQDPGPDPLLVSSFSSPLTELLRGQRWFLEHERNLIRTALQDKAGLRARTGVRISYSRALTDQIVAYLIETPDPQTFLLCGPVWLRDPQTLREPFTQQYVETAADHIIETDTKFRHQTEPALSVARVRRVLQHRAAISEGDLLERIQQVHATIDCIMSGTAPEPLTADQIERVALAICFWGRRPDHLGADPEGCVLQTAVENPSEHDQRVFVLKRSSSPDQPLSFEIVPRGSTRVSESLFLRPPVTDKWSFFCDTFRGSRNAYFLERILLIRLWLQDKFNGIAAMDESGGEASRTLLTQLTKRLQRILGADACILYRYAPGEMPADLPSEGAWEAADGRPAKADERGGYLSRLAYSYAADSSLQALSEEHARQMEVIGGFPEKRRKSISYQALDTKATIYGADIAPWDEFPADEPVKTILAAPLLSRECAWGVIEIIGCQPYQFPYGSIRWVEEISRILTPILSDHWLTYRLREISRIAMTEPKAASESTKYQEVLDHVRKLMMASSARLYLQETTKTDVFVQRAHAGQEWPEGVPTTFDLFNPKSESARVVTEGLPWNAGEIGKERFAETQGALGPLERAGHKGCAIIPIYDGRQNCFASLMLTSTDNTFNMAMWDGTVDAISRNLNVVFEAIHLQDTKVEARQALLAHTIKTRAERVDGSGNNLLRRLEPLLNRTDLVDSIPLFANEIEAMASISAQRGGRALSEPSREILGALRAMFPPSPPTSDPESRRNSITALIEGLQNDLALIRKSAVSIAGGANEEDPKEADPETWEGTWADLRLCLQDSLKPTQGRPGPRSNMQVPDKSILPQGVTVRLPSAVLIEVLNNLADNARKYDFSPPSSSVRVRSEPSKNRYAVEFRNLAPRVTEAEARQLESNSRHRAPYARSKDRSGSGIGLKFIRDQALAWGFGFKYSVPRLSSVDPTERYGWHSLELTFTVSTTE